MQVYTSLLAVEGWWVLVPLAVPIALSTIPLLGRSPTMRRRLAIPASVLLLAFGILASLSIGTFYLPAAAVLLVAAFVPPRPAGPDPSDPAV